MVELPSWRKVPQSHIPLKCSFDLGGGMDALGHGSGRDLDYHPWIIGRLTAAFRIVVVASRKVESMHRLVDEMNLAVVGQPMPYARGRKELLIRLTRTDRLPHGGNLDAREENAFWCRAYSHRHLGEVLGALRN